MNSLMWTAGTIEFVGGIALILGLFTKVVAAIAALEMLVAIVTFHLPQGWNPFIFPPGNGAELPLLYIAAFLILIINGGGKWSLEKVVLKKEVF